MLEQVKSLTDPEHIARIGDLIVECETGAELPGRAVRTSTHPPTNASNPAHRIAA